MPKTITYLWVSTLEQDKTKTDILSLANEKGLGKVEFVEDKISGKVSWKDRFYGSQSTPKRGCTFK